MTETTTIQDHIAAIQATARRLEGQEVVLTTRRGQRFEGELHSVKQASCQVGFGGRYAYGGVASIAPLYTPTKAKELICGDIVLHLGQRHTVTAAILDNDGTYFLRLEAPDSTVDYMHAKPGFPFPRITQ